MVKVQEGDPMYNATQTIKIPRSIKILPVLLTVVLSLVGCSLFGPDSDTQTVIDAINAIGDVTVDSERSVSDARDAYDELNDEQKSKVENYETLTNAESELKKLQKEKLAKDKEAADPVANEIDAIGDVTLDKKDQISKARDSYDSLTTSQKALVENYQTLLKAEETIEKLEQALAIGETVTTSEWKATLTDARISSTLESSESRSCWEPSQGTCFLIMEFDIECLTSNQPTIDDDGLTDIKATYNGNNYSDWDIDYIAYELWVPVSHTYLEANIPCHLYVYTVIPDKALDDGQAVTVDLKVGGEQKTITVR